MPGPFSYALHHHFAAAAAGATTTFNPANKSTFATLSNGNLTMTWAGTTPGSDLAAAIATTNVTTGKRIFGFVADNSSSFLGLCPSTTNFGAGDFPGGGSPGVFIAGAVVLVNGSPDPQPPPPSFEVGDVIELIFDPVSLQAWIAVNGVIGNGDPVAGTNGYTVPAGSNFAWAGLSVPTSLTANFGQTAFSYSGSGITPWG